MHFRSRRPGARGASANSNAGRASAGSSLPPLPGPAPRAALGPLGDEERATIEASAFAPLGLSMPLLRAILAEGYTEPTPVQREVIPHAALGKDVIACAQTGTGKTAAFVLPLLDLLAKGENTGEIRALILTPTRELAAQIGERIGAYGVDTAIRHTVIYGGVSQLRQEEALRKRVDILVATPGRLLDLMQQRKVRLDGVRHYVLDEADRMLDMGFLRDVQRITAALPKVRHTLFFSATFPPAIEDLARRMLVSPVRVSIAPEVTTAERIDQSVMFVSRENKRALLQSVLSDPKVHRAIVFARTKHGANRIAEQLDRVGIGSMAIHGNKSQGARERALASFKAGTTRVLVATDLAARGIDVDGISHVVNFDLPNVAESYVHRIGRTARAGSGGTAISFCDHDERSLLADIERFIRARIPVAATSISAAAQAASDAAGHEAPRPPRMGGGHGGGGGGSRGRHFAPRRR